MNDTVFYQRPQSVTIPLYAYDIICNDLDLFNGDRLRLKLNTILNLIVLNLSGESQADFFYYGKNIHGEIENAISICHKEILGEAKNLSLLLLQAIEEKQLTKNLMLFLPVVSENE